MHDSGKQPSANSLTQTQGIQMQKNIESVGAELQSILDEVGVDGFPMAKALYLKEVEIVDADGQPIDPETLDVEIALKQTVEEEEEPLEEDDLELKAEETEEDEDASEDAKKPSKQSGTRQKPGDRDRFGNVVPKELDIEQIVSKAVDSRLSKTVRVKAHDLRVDGNRDSMIKYGSVKHISRVNTANPDLEAYRFGRWAAACMGHKKSVDWCANNGIQTKAHLETVNSTGGFLVPDEFSNTLISLREEYGVFRRNASVEPMASDTKRIPKRTATLSASFVGEATAGSETTQTFAQVNLVAKKLMVLTSISNELAEDAMINIGDSVAGEIAYAFALKEDQCGFLGDGTSTYGGIVGAIEAINNVSSNASIETCRSGDTTAATVVLGDIHDLMGKLPMYADTPGAKFFMHKTVYSALVERLIYSSLLVKWRQAIRELRSLATLLSSRRSWLLLRRPMVQAQPWPTSTRSCLAIWVLLARWVTVAPTLSRSLTAHSMRSSRMRSSSVEPNGLTSTTTRPEPPAMLARSLHSSLRPRKQEMKGT